MKPVQRWWCFAGALMCAAVMVVPRARADEPRPGLRDVATPATASLAPASGSRVAPELRAAALREAEAAYRAGRSEEAMSAFERLAAADPLDPRPWLRLGNLHQGAGREAEALDAYRRAALAMPATPAQAEARAKALLNIALLNVQQASRAIDEFDDARSAGAFPADARPMRDDVARQVGAQRRRANDAALHSGLVTAVAPSTPQSTPTSAPSPTQVEPTEPYTVDRWVARPKARASSRSAGRSAVTEPITDSPLPPSPAVETIRGVGQASAR